MTFHKLKHLIEKQKLQTKIQNLEKKLSNNAMLWEQLAEAEKKENILRQELIATQSSMGNAEKQIEDLKDYVSKLESEKNRLTNFKQQKGKRLEELEAKV